MIHLQACRVPQVDFGVVPKFEEMRQIQLRGTKAMASTTAKRKRIEMITAIDAKIRAMSDAEQEARVQEIYAGGEPTEEESYGLFAILFGGVSSDMSDVEK
jgi:hypothetical protein